MAWLNAVPKPDPRSRRGKADRAVEQISRLARMKREGITPVMPPNPMPHFVERLIELGLSEAAGMGVGPLSWASIAAWQRLTAARLQPWEARLLRQLSVEYVAEGRRAETEAVAAPFHTAPTEAEVRTEAARLKAFLG